MYECQPFAPCCVALAADGAGTAVGFDVPLNALCTEEAKPLIACQVSEPTFEVLIPEHSVMLCVHLCCKLYLQSVWWLVLSCLVAFGK